MDRRSRADNARLMAMIWVALADSAITCFESKYFHMCWRPQSALPLAGTDGNLNTILDATWTPVVLTPNHPEFLSAHACTNSAVIQAVQAHFGTSAISFLMEQAP